MVIRPPSRASLKRWLLEALLFIVILVAIQFWQQRNVPSGPAPFTAGRLANGQNFELGKWRAAYPDRPVVLHFWAEWCPICTMEEASIDAVAHDWPVVTVAMQSGTAEQVTQQLEKKSLSWPALVDADGRIAGEYGLKGVPAFVVIDRKGRIRSISVGYTSELGMRARLWWAEHF